MVPNGDPEAGPVERSAPFRDMAGRIDLNAGHGFGGAFVIVLPSGETHHALILDGADNPAMFVGALSARVGIIAAELENADRQGGGFGRR